MAEKQEVFEMEHFSSSFQFFDYHIRSIALQILTPSVSGDKIRENDCDFKLRPNFCKFGVWLKSKLERNREDLIVKTSVEKFNVENVLALRDQICQNTALKQYLLTGVVDEFNNIGFYLNRKAFIRDVIKQILLNGLKYGQKSKPLGDKQHFLTNYGGILIDCIQVDELSAGNLRTVLLNDHVLKILQQNCSNVATCTPTINFLSKDDKLLRGNILKVFGTLCDGHGPQDISIDPFELESVRVRLESSVLDSQYRTENDDKRSHTCNSEKTVIKPLDNQASDDFNINRQSNATMVCTSEEQELPTKHDDLLLSENISLNNIDSERRISTRGCGNVQLNLHKYVEDLKTVKGNYLPVAFVKNLKEIEVSSIWDDLLRLELLDYKTKLHNTKDENRKIIHVFGQEKKFQFQKIALVWRMVATSNLAEKQIFLCHGSVKFFDTKTCLNDRVSAQEFMRIRTKQVKHSYFMKYGPIVNDDKWKATITKMAIAVMKLEILSAPLKNQVKLDATDSTECPSSCRQALFVLYNCARLSKIMEHYNDAVEKGIYPQLPDIDDVDFSHLKDETEWNLFMKYVVNYPDIVARTTQSLEQASVEMSFISNKIAQFLVSLSQDVSCYYSRVHILGEPRLHLYPVMFARLYLIKVLYQVMKNAFYLLNIETIDQM